MKFLALNKSLNIFGFHIAYYALFILGGAIIAYILSRYFNRKAGYDDTILEGTFYLAFPMGIVGARIWYVIAQWSKEFASNPLTDVTLFGNTFKIWTPLAFWEGGLAIQGGAILGIAIGIWYIHHRKPNYNVLAIADLVVPNILIAQAIGRWGNFFNQEVYGLATDPGPWKFLGSWFIDQMTINGEFRVPLFLIEGIINIIGYILIMFGVRKGLKKYLKNGQLVCSYIIWYGVVRVILEPLRDSEFQMGENTMASELMAIAFIVVGIILMVGCYFLDKKLKKRTADVPENLKNYFIETEQENEQNQGNII